MATVKQFKNILTLSKSGKPFFHLHPPKTGGSSIIAALREHVEFEEAYGHRYIAMSKKLGITSNSYHFTTLKMPNTPVTLSVRNPYTRFMSILSFYKLAGEHNHGGVIPQHYTMNNLVDHILDLYKTKQMKNHIIHRSNLSAYGNCSRWEDFIKDNEYYIIKFESLDEDVKRIYNIDNLPHVHKTTEKKASDIGYHLTTQEELNKFNDMTQPDFERYGYKMYTDIQELQHEVRSTRC